MLSSILLLSAVVTLAGNTFSMTKFIGIHWLVDDIQRNKCRIKENVLVPNACLVQTIRDFQQNSATQSPSTSIDTTITLSIGTDNLPQRVLFHRCINVASHMGSQQLFHRLQSSAQSIERQENNWDVV